MIFVDFVLLACQVFVLFVWVFLSVFVFVWSFVCFCRCFVNEVFCLFFVFKFDPLYLVHSYNHDKGHFLRMPPPPPPPPTHTQRHTHSEEREEDKGTEEERQG